VQLDKAAFLGCVFVLSFINLHCGVHIFLFGLVQGGSKVAVGTFASSHPSAIDTGVVQQNFCAAARPPGLMYGGIIPFGMKLHARPDS